MTEFALEAGRRYRPAVDSGGRREQIEWALRTSPIAYLRAVVVALATTYPAERLTEADCVLRNWGEVAFK